jgi:hypothetical protein
MAQSWRDSRDRIAALLATVAITEPAENSIQRVYETPPATVQDVPCFIIYPPALTVERGSSLRIKSYTVRLRLLVMDADADRAADFADAFREATIDVFDADVTLDHKCAQIIGPRIEEAASFAYGGREFIGMDCFLTVQIKEPKAFS